MQYYLSGLIGFLIIEMVANWGKLRRLLWKVFVKSWQYTIGISMRTTGTWHQLFSFLSVGIFAYLDQLALSFLRKSLYSTLAGMHCHFLCC